MSDRERHISEDVLRRAIAGDAAAGAAVLRELGPQVRGRIEHKIGRAFQSLLDADDVMQVTYLEAFLEFPKFKPTGEGACLAWLTRIAENNLRDAIKQLEAQKRPDPRRRVTPTAAPDQNSYVALVDILGVTNTTPSRQAATGEIRGAIDEALAKLPDDYANVIRMHDLECLEPGEVAARLKRSQGAMYMLLSRARDRLKDVLGSESKFFSMG